MLLTDVTRANVSENGTSGRTVITNVWRSHSMQKLSLAAAFLVTSQANSADSVVWLKENIAVQIILVNYNSPVQINIPESL
jgi:hypothetical protein